MDQDASFGRLLRRLRKARDLTQEALAQQAYCAVDTIKKIEAGVRRPSRQLAAQFADCFGLAGDERTAFLAAARAITGDEIDLPAETKAMVGRALTAVAPHRRSNLPHHTTPLIGRAQELDDLARLLGDAQVRLVTITGPGGIGKTRLASALAEQLLVAERFPDGVFFVPLAPIEATERIVPALAEALEFPLEAGQQPARSPRQQVFDYLHPKRLTLILDNVEHLLRGSEIGADAAELVAGVLDAAAGVAILATSRERLKLREEHLYPLGGLEVPGAAAPDSYAAVALFVQRARLLRPDFAPTADDQGVIARICRLVEGMPLAIELAAGWIDTLALAEIAAEVTRSLDVLATELRDVPARHRSMRAVFDATWQRLGAAEQAVFARFSVLRGGGTRGAVQAVTGAMLPQLHALVGASLLYYDARRDRYTVHELLRQYAAEKLAADTADERATRDRHAATFCGLLRDLKADLHGARQREALLAIEADGENARAAWEWAAQRQHVALIDQAIDSLGHFYEWQGRAEEGAAAYRLAAAMVGSSAPETQRVRARIVAWQSWCAHLLGDSAAGALLAQSQYLLDGLDRTDIDTRAERAFVLLHAGQLAAERDFPAARAIYEQSRALFQALGDRWGEATALFGLGDATLNLAGDYDLAGRWLTESLALRRVLDDRLGIVETLTLVSMNARYAGRVAESEQLARESYALATSSGNRRLIALAGSNLGAAWYWSGDHVETHRVLQESAAIYADLGDRRGLMVATFRLAVAQMHLGRYADARATIEEHQHMAYAFGSPIDAGGGLDVLASVALAEGGYAEAQRLIAQAISGLTTIGERWHLTFAHANGALAERGVGNRQGAWRHTVAALRLGLEIRSWLPVVHTLRAAALLLTDDAELERAVELYALAEREDPRDDAWSMALWGRELAAVAAALPAEAATAAQARCQARSLWATARELLTALEAAGWDAENAEM